MMQNEFEKYLKQTCCCSADKTHLLAVSGGIDSVVMAHLFHKAGMNFAFAHCNFHLRGAESDGDQSFVENLASRMNVPCHVNHFDTQVYANSRGISIQMAARELRYEWFTGLKEKYGFDSIAVGHNLNDLVETVLLNFARGCGIRGLSGIKPRQGSIVRPLLFATRSEIHEFAKSHSLDWHEDSSNAETKYIRNRIRHNIIPEFEAINPAFITNATDTISRLNQTEQLFNLSVENIKRTVWSEFQDKYLIDIAKLRKFPAVDTLLFELLRGFGCTQLHVESILSSFDSIPGKRFFTKTHCITRDREHLIITQNFLPPDAEMMIDRDTVMINYPIHLIMSQFRLEPGYTIPAESKYAVLDSDQIIFPMKLRRWEAGDNFRPLGLKGSKKISDYLINQKVPMPDKQHIWVLESAGKIVWVVNHRIDDRFRITPKTRNVLLIEYINEFRD